MASFNIFRWLNKVAWIIIAFEGLFILIPITESSNPDSLFSYFFEVPIVGMIYFSILIGLMIFTIRIQRWLKKKESLMQRQLDNS